MLTVTLAIPILMGANIGTSMTNTLVSLAHSGQRSELRRAFAAATVHDMFNWLCVLVMLPVEIGTGSAISLSCFFIRTLGYLEHASGALVDAVVGHQNHSLNGTRQPSKLLAHLTEPLLNRIILLDRHQIAKIAQDVASNETTSLVQRDCGANITAFVPCKSVLVDLIK